MVYEQTIRDLFSYYDCDVLDVRIKSFKIEEVKFQSFPLDKYSTERHPLFTE
jgi:hypothetical protein